MKEQDHNSVSRRSFLGQTSAALVAAASLPVLAVTQQTTNTHSGVNEQELGPKNPTLAAQAQDSVFPPVTDAGGQPPFKYPFALSHRRMQRAPHKPTAVE